VLAGAEKAALCCAGQRLPPLPRITFITRSAAAGISICRRRNSCKAATTGGRLAIVLSMGMRPAGAIMVLLFSKVIGVFGWGMAARWRWRREPR
jgi:hypothetical protein